MAAMKESLYLTGWYVSIPYITHSTRGETMATPCNVAGSGEDEVNQILRLAVPKTSSK